MRMIRLDGRCLTRRQLVAVAHGAQVELAIDQLPAVARAADFLAEQVRREEPIYGVSTGFGSNAACSVPAARATRLTANTCSETLHK